ncbi:uncharacterized protein CIMG_12863 [Coccidioides immitis RS]|uniref:Uncharacterized protein n=1 Tax=Coccidioides immitis (strain RS) TaxID=246410 RepID=A0A0D8JVJ2_COCIM|nr:uncharacterized protein CIMG_12863 [Coccidioides immitis RS]KJF60298.1 hypothetical protein CIMG_12863 [Coccidioides immitis RS]
MEDCFLEGIINSLHFCATYFSWKFREQTQHGTCITLVIPDRTYVRSRVVVSTDIQDTHVLTAFFETSQKIGLFMRYRPASLSHHNPEAETMASPF